jgi:xanthosine utilization system XapX-like protein
MRVLEYVVTLGAGIAVGVVAMVTLVKNFSILGC